jgi:hypothetical protein
MPEQERPARKTRILVHPGLLGTQLGKFPSPWVMMGSPPSVFDVVGLALKPY